MSNFKRANLVLGKPEEESGQSQTIITSEARNHVGLSAPALYEAVMTDMKKKANKDDEIGKSIDVPTVDMRTDDHHHSASDGHNNIHEDVKGFNASHGYVFTDQIVPDNENSPVQVIGIAERIKYINARLPQNPDGSIPLQGINRSPFRMGKEWFKDNCLGEGSYGRCYECTVVEDGSRYCVKEIEFRDEQCTEDVDVLKEINMMAWLQHENIVTYYRATIDPIDKKGYIFMELMSGGTLEHLIASCHINGVPLENTAVYSYTKQIASGINYLHQNKIVHCDLKPDNVLRDHSGRILRITDFGISSCTYNDDGAFDDVQEIGHIACQMLPGWESPEKKWENRDKKFNQKRCLDFIEHSGQALEDNFVKFVQGCLKVDRLHSLSSLLEDYFPP